MIDPHRLRILRSVVASGSLQAAADHLGYTSSAISQQLATLQRETGLVLFEKSGRGVRPTAAGLALAAESEEVLATMARLDSLVKDLVSGRTGRLSVGYFSSVGAAWMPWMAHALISEFPDLILDLGLNELITETPMRPDLNIVVEFEDPLTPPGYRRHHLLDEPFTVLVPRDHRFGRRRTLPLAEFAHERWVDNDLKTGPTRQEIIRACHAAGFTPRFTVEAKDHHTAMAFVSAGVGVTMLPRLASRDAPAGVHSVMVTKPKPTRRIVLLVREAIADSPVARRAVELLVGYAKAKSAG